ncbi:MAG TPA: right-handed parallel beta-helix repeat-containing protein [Thermoanaerobaculia bacterium]|nr:right-handed parallel beta-helix repeat-containing protein [Thermoanaerobaculia bacterium]
MRILCTLLFTLSISAADAVKITIVPPDALDAGGNGVSHITIENLTRETLSPVVVEVFSNPGRVTGTPPAFIPTLDPGVPVSFDVAVQAPFQFGATNISVRVRAADPIAAVVAAVSRTYWREFAVTSAADSGPGSLRQAILDMNATEGCQQDPVLPKWIWPCKAAFQPGQYAIRPLTPLPALLAYQTSIDASEQPVSLDGSALATGNGVTAETQGTWGYAEVKGLTITGFPWNGVFSSKKTYLTVTECSISANGARGIAGDAVWGSITNNEISGNRRSGIFFTGAFGNSLFIRDNRITGNGASGIFVGDFFFTYTYPVIENNVIAHNTHFGIALSRNAPIAVLGNSIHDNALGGIDIGLDGPTHRRDGVPGIAGGVIPPPVIASIRYANGVTTIEGFSAAGNSRHQVLLFANRSLDPDGRAEGEQFLGTTPMKDRNDTSFVLEYAGDLRGQYLTGISYAATRWGLDETVITTSEFSLPVRVE